MPISEELRRKLSESHKGQVSWNKGLSWSEEARKKNSQAHKGLCAGEKHPMFGKHHSEETKRKIGEKSKGRYCSPETRKKISDGLRGPRNHNGEHIENGRCMIYDPTHPNANGNYVERARFVMAQVLGRPLRIDELVHHKDGNTLNDVPSNLEIVTRVEHGLIHKPRKGVRTCANALSVETDARIPTEII